MLAKILQRVSFRFLGSVHGILGASSDLRLRAFDLPERTFAFMIHVLGQDIRACQLVVFGFFCSWYPRRFFGPSFKSGLLSAKAEITVYFTTILNTVRNFQSRALPKFSLRTTN